MEVVKVNEYYEKNRDEMLRQHKIYKKKNKVVLAEKAKEYNRKHKGNKKIYDKKYYGKNKEHITKRNFEYRQHHWENFLTSAQKHRQKIKIKIFSHYGWKCACCGETRKEFLTIDHINGGGTKHRKETGGGLGFYYWLIRNGFPKEYRTLCMNCNFALGKYKYCPHERENV